jgi:hypothetical protein
MPSKAIEARLRTPTYREVGSQNLEIAVFWILKVCDLASKNIVSIKRIKYF